MPYQGQAGDFRLMSRRVVDALRAMPERRRFLRGMVAWVGYEQVPIEYRRAGPSKRPRSLLSRPLAPCLRSAVSVLGRAAGRRKLVGMLVATISAAAAVVVFGLTVTGAVSASLGVWILVAVLFLGGVQLVSVGILGRYLARVHAQVARAALVPRRSRRARVDLAPIVCPRAPRSRCDPDRNLPGGATQPAGRPWLH